MSFMSVISMDPSFTYGSIMVIAWNPRCPEVIDDRGNDTAPRAAEW